MTLDTSQVSFYERDLIYKKSCIKKVDLRKNGQNIISCSHGETDE